MIRCDKFGFRRMTMKQAVALLEGALGVQFHRRESSYSGLYYTCRVGRSAGYEVSTVGGRYELNMEYHSLFRSVLTVHDVPEMEMVREKLLRRHGGEVVLLDISVLPEISESDYDEEEEDEDDLPEDWTSRNDYYLFRDTDILDAAALADRVIQEHYKEMERVLPSVQDRMRRGHHGSYSLGIEPRTLRPNMGSPLHPVEMWIHDLPAMDALREKLLAAHRGCVFLESRLSADIPCIGEQQARDEEADPPPRRHDVYGLGDMPLEDALPFVGGALGIPVWIRDGSYPGKYDSPERYGGLSYAIELCSDKPVWRSMCPEHRTILVLNGLPDMDEIREKLSAGPATAVFLQTAISDPPQAYWSPPEMEPELPAGDPTPFEPEADADDEHPAGEHPILAVLRGRSIPLT